MDKVKSALSDFTHRSGHHDTTVHESVAPAVTHETIKPHQHEEVHTAVDKEVHQDHYHRTIQPVQDREVLPETHTAKLGGVQHREFDHRDHDHTKRNLAQEAAQFKDERRVESHTQSQSVAPTIGGEHVHHHIHETIQPVIHKEVIQPNVVHTTVPIHEVHHNKATHHEATALPTMTMDEFKHKGGALTGREERYDEFEGVPKNIGGVGSGGFGHTREGGLGHTANPADRNNDGRVDARDLTGGQKGYGHTANPADRNNDGRVDARDLTGQQGHSTTGRHVGTDGAIGSGRNDGTHHNSSTTSNTKPSLMDKLNPKVDANGDGKAGFMK